MRQKYGDDLSKHPSSDIGLWCKVTGGCVMEAYMAWVVQLIAEYDVHLGYCDPSLQYKHSHLQSILMKRLKKMLQTQKIELEQEAKLREDKKEQEAKLREDKRERRYIKQMKQVVRDRQRSFMLAMLSFQKDGASTSRQTSSSRHNRQSGSNSNRCKLPHVRANEAIWYGMLDSDESDGK